MRWEVQGADAATGKETTITLEAVTAEEAEKQARYNGMLVSHVRKAAPKPSPKLDYAAPTPAPRPGVVPEYAAIVSGARLTSFFARVVALFGAVAFGVAILAVAIAVYQSLGGNLDTSEKTLAVTITAGCVFYGLGCFVVAVFLSMHASLALAVRDMARNSFNR